MPRSLSTLTAEEQGLYDALSQQPQETGLPLVLADYAEDHGKENRSALLHLNTARLALWELLRHRALTNDECAQVLQNPNDTAQQISRLLGNPDPNAPLPNVLTEEGFNQQFAFAQTLLAAYGLPTGSVSAEQVLQRLHEDQSLREQVERGRSLLLLVPRRPLATCTDALRDGLRRNEHLLGLGNWRLNDEPVYVNPVYNRQPLQYLASKQTATDPDRWLTEQQWLDEKEVDVLFVEPSPNVPAAARNRSAEQAWASRRPGEALLTPQAWCILFLTLLERRGCTLDRNTLSLLAGARFVQSNHTSSGSMPCGIWDAGYRRARLGWDYPGSSNEVAGPRAASEGS